MRGVAIRRRRYQNELGAKRTQRLLLFLRLGVGHDDDRLVAAGIGDDGQSDTGVARRAFDNRAAG